jgi:hypothetical protein
MSKKPDSRYQRQLKGGAGSGTSQAQVVRGGGQGRKESQEKIQQRLDGDEIDAKFGYVRIKDGPKRIGWLLNYLPIVSANQEVFVVCCVTSFLPYVVVDYT